MQKTWYALYVKSRAEKKVSAELAVLGIEHYLPLQKVLKQWSDRKKWVEIPLFTSYVFVHIDPTEYYQVLNIFGAVKYISFEGKAVPVPEKQIEAIRYYLNEKDPEILDKLEWHKGQKVEVIAGSLTGLEGKLIEVKGKSIVSVEIEAVGSAILLKIPKSKLRITPE
jgi:transcription antitermination factor NusG